MCTNQRTSLAQADFYKQWHPAPDRRGVFFVICVMRYLLLILFMTAIVSCGPTGLAKKYSGCDSLVITFNRPGTDSVVNIVTTTEKKAIRKLLGYMDGKEKGRDSCAFDGNMSFYIQGQLVLPAVFKYRAANCREFLFEQDNKMQCRKLSNEAADFLKSLEEGRNFY